MAKGNVEGERIMENAMQEKAIKAAIKYLGIQGYEDVREFEGHVVGLDGEQLVLASVSVVDGFCSSDHEPRGTREKLALKLLCECDHTGSVRFDDLQLIVMREDRAFLRHERDCTL